MSIFIRAMFSRIRWDPSMTPCWSIHIHRPFMPWCSVRTYIKSRFKGQGGEPYQYYRPIIINFEYEYINRLVWFMDSPEFFDHPSITDITRVYQRHYWLLRVGMQKTVKIDGIHISEVWLPAEDVIRHILDSLMLYIGWMAQVLGTFWMPFFTVWLSVGFLNVGCCLQIFQK